MIAALAAIALAPENPMPVTKVYTDWIVGCDNNLGCKALSLQPVFTAGIAPVADGALLVSVMRALAPGSPFIVAIRARNPERRIEGLAVDGVPIDMTGQAGHFVVEYSGPASRLFIAKLADGKSLSATDRKGAPIGSASTAGIRSAIEYIEKVQGQSKGSVRIAPVILPPRARGKPARLSASDLAELSGHDPCSSGTAMLAFAVPGFAPPPQYVRLDRTATMLIMHDRCRGNNAGSRLLLLDNRGHARRLPFEPEISGLELEMDQDAERFLPNVWWEDSRRYLWTHSIGRKDGDCGEQRAYVWVDGRFVLVYHAQMPVCRGTPDFIVTYFREVAFQGQR